MAVPGAICRSACALLWCCPAGNATYASAAFQHYQAGGGRWQMEPVVSWDAHFTPPILLLNGWVP